MEAKVAEEWMGAVRWGARPWAPARLRDESDAKVAVKSRVRAVAVLALNFMLGSHFYGKGQKSNKTLGGWEYFPVFPLIFSGESASREVIVFRPVSGRGFPTSPPAIHL